MPTRTPKDGDTSLTSEELVRLRASVREWTGRGAEALREFGREETGSFWKNSKHAEDDLPGVNVTTTARVYAALYAVNRASSGRRESEPPIWIAWLKTFVGEARIDITKDGFFEKSKPDELVNNFDVAHYADFFVSTEYAKRFFARDAPADVFRMFSKPKDAKARLVPILKEAIKESCGGPIRKGQVLFEANQEDSRHFFATLHVLRGLHALGAHYDQQDTPDAKSASGFDKQTIDDAVEGARLFAIEQCYYYQRGTTHRQDPVRLAFSGCIYAIYSVHIDKDLCCAIIESLALAQQENGSWPATHPIIRKGGRLPWHITSHEVALCLTWLYFQPRIPDAARPILVAMMRKHFQRAVIPTYVTTAFVNDKAMHGWQDDHTVSPNLSVGWATAIVTHFLANFCLVLNDHINRLVIEELHLEEAARHYLIDDTMTASSRSLKWRHDQFKANTLPGRAIWPDLPPNAWTPIFESSDALAKRITDKWTDPTPKAGASNAFATEIIRPILADPAERPIYDKSSGLLPGDPGTRKTSFVKQIAEVMRWPMVPVPASLIFADGFERMEAHADEVFRKLSYLRTVIIFFDEFEEFFLKREAKLKQSEDAAAESQPASRASKAEPEDQDDEKPAAWTVEDPLPIRVIEGGYQNRTIAAFTTSAMLPRLQELHDVGACLIFLATNHPEKIDDAIKRPGRFDYTLKIDYPGQKRLSEYLRDIQPEAAKKLGLNKETSGGIKDAVISAIDAYKSGSDQCSADDLKFSHVEGVIRDLVALRADGDKSVILDTATALLASATRLPAADGNPPALYTRPKT